MTNLFQTSEKNPTFSTKGNGQFGPVIRTGWKPVKLGDKNKSIILSALNNSDVQQVYKRGKSIYALYLNGVESVIN